MKTVIIFLFIATFITAAFAQNAKEKTPVTRTDTTGNIVYTCTMHPEVITDKPGKCPKCGMALVAKKVDKIYNCAMHPEVISDKPGKCPKCGMDLVEKKSTAKKKENRKTN